jgi:hypothetical protein
MRNGSSGTENTGVKTGDGTEYSCYWARFGAPKAVSQSTGGLLAHFPFPALKTIGTGRVCNTYVHTCTIHHALRVLRGGKSERGESVACTYLHVQYTLICVTKYSQRTGGLVPRFPYPSRGTIETGRVCNAYMRKCKECCIVLAVQDWERSLGLRHVQITTRLRGSTTTELNHQIRCRSVSRLGTSCWGYEEHNSSFCAA